MRRVFHRKLQRTRDVRFHSALRQRRVHRKRAAGQRPRIEKAEHHISVGYGRPLRAAPITSRPRIAASAFGTDHQQATSVDTRNRAAAGTDFGNID